MATNAETKVGRSFEVNHESYKIEPSGYVAELVQKTLVVIGYSGNITVPGTLNALRVMPGGTPRYPSYVISRMGSIYELYPESYWCNHTGLQPFDKRNSGYELDRRSIGILMCGGILRADGEEALLPESQQPPEYKLTRYPDEQHEAAAWLIRRLCKRHRIPVALLPKARRQSTAELTKFNGVVGYANIHNNPLYNGPGPGFDWSALELYLAGDPWYSELTSPQLSSTP
jgi:N-acetyl-anhydromuramyl-L-alanine amidase AmpD